MFTWKFILVAHKCVYNCVVDCTKRKKSEPNNLHYTKKKNKTHNNRNDPSLTSESKYCRA